MTQVIKQEEAQKEPLEKKQKEQRIAVQNELDEATSFTQISYIVHCIISVCIVLGGLLAISEGGVHPLILLPMGLGILISYSIYIFSKVLSLISKNLTKINNPEIVEAIEDDEHKKKEEESPL